MHSRYSMSEKVRVKNPGFLKRLFHPFHPYRNLFGKEGTVVFAVIGEQSERLIYTVCFEINGKSTIAYLYWYEIESA